MSKPLSKSLFRAQISTLLLAGLVSAGAYATEPVSPAKKALVQKMLVLQQPGIEGIARALIEQPISPLMMQVQGVIQNRVPADKREAVAKDIQGDLKKYGESASVQVRDRAIALAPSTIGEVMTQKFSEDELKQLVAWLESPVARKYQAALPEFQKALTEKLVAETRPQIEPKFKELNDTIARKLTASATLAAPTAPAKP
jgi:uncharacterized protein